jgi:hypothetical protein
VGVRSGVSDVYVADLLAPYALNNLEDADIMYVGKVSPDGKWLVQQFGKTTGVMTYANFSNNPAVSGYAAAWTGRAGLTYGTYETLTGV